MGFPFGEVVLFEALVVGVSDAHGNPVESFASPVSVGGWGFDPGGSVESFEPGRNPVVTSPKLFRTSNDFLPAARDRCTVRGLLFVVDGDPAAWRSPFSGWQPGISVGLERVSG